MGLSDVVVVGASLAGTRSAEALRREGYEGRLTIIGAEPHPPYQRPPLSKQLLAGEWERPSIDLRVERVDADFRLSTRATALDFESRELVLSGAHGEQERLRFDGLVIATGCRPRLLPDAPQPGEMEGVYALRTVDDCFALRAEFGAKPKVAVVGAGFIGCEVASTCRQCGLDVTLIDTSAAPLTQSLGEMAQVIAKIHTDNGTSLRMGVGVSGLLGDGRVEGVRLTDGGVVEADLVVLGLGVVPETDWLDGSGVHVDNGVLCDSRCNVEGAPGVVAAGDVARWFHPTARRHLRVEHFDNASEQANVAARALLDADSARPYDPVPSFWSDQYDAKIELIGLPDPADRVEVLEGDVARRSFIAAYGYKGLTVAALSVNNGNRLLAYRTAVAQGVPFPPPVPEDRL